MVQTTPASWDELAAEIAAAVGKSPQDVPRPGTHEFDEMLGLLLDEHPGLAVRVQAWLVHSTAPVASQREIAREAQKAEARHRLGSLFTKADHTQPQRRRLSKVAVLIAGLTLMAVLWLVGHLRQSPPPSGELQTRRPAPTRAAAPTPGNGLPRQEPPAQTGTSASGHGTTSTSTGTGTGGQSPLPPPPMPFTLPNLGSPSSSGTQAVAAGSDAHPESQVVVGAADQAAKADTIIVGGRAQAADVSGASGAGTTVVGTVPPASTAAPGPTVGLAAQAGGVPRFQIGDQFTVTLVTPIAVSPAWQALPAVAQATTGPLTGWQVIGAATQGQDGSLQIAWTQAISPDRKTTVVLDGVAYDPKVGKPGVPGATSAPMAPQAARTALSGALGAVSQYVQAEIQAQQTQVNGLTASITSQVPPFWQILAGQLATGFQSAPVQTGGTIIVTRAAAGTPIVVFITKPSQASP